MLPRNRNRASLPETDSFEVEFRLLIGGKSFAIEPLLGKASQLVDLYLSAEPSHCCDFRGGYFIWVVGCPWTGALHVDEFFMTASWWRAICELISGKSKQTKAFPWEGSNMSLTMRGDHLIMEDTLRSGEVVSPPVTVSAKLFFSEILRGGLAFEKLSLQILEEVSIRSNQAGKKLKGIEASALAILAKNYSKGNDFRDLKKLQEAYFKLYSQLPTVPENEMLDYVEGSCELGQFDVALSQALTVARELDRQPLITLVWYAQAEAGLWEEAWETCRNSTFIALPDEMKQLLELAATENRLEWVKMRLPELIELDPELASKIPLTEKKEKES